MIDYDLREKWQTISNVGIKSAARQSEFARGRKLGFPLKQKIGSVLI
jgi:hypothetical protein